jgi:2,3-bisphosphoglycerate-independent phosphoglycerate mutase
VELIDQKILAPVYEYLKDTADDFKILVLPDHPTPIEIRTHSMEPVPFFLYDSRKDAVGVDSFTEATAAKTGLYIPDGFTLLDRVIEKN